MTFETTKADEALREAKQHIDTAIKLMSGIVVDQVPGTSNWTSVYRNRIRNGMNKLIDVREELNNP